MRVIGYLTKWEGGEKPAALQVDFVDDEQQQTICSFIVTIDEPDTFMDSDTMLKYEAAPRLLNEIIPQMQEALQMLTNPPLEDDSEAAENT